MIRCLFVAALLLTSFAAAAQAPAGAVAAPDALPIPRNHQRAYTAGTRTATGVPGPNYWQNSATYTVAVEFDPQTRVVNGTVGIEYRNASPDSLRSLLFKLYPNVYQKGAPRDRRFEPTDVHDGVEISRLTISGQVIDVAKLRPDNTNLRVVAPKAIGPRSTVRVEMTYRYTLNKESHMRTGEVAPGAAFVAYFFPRIAVYDDVRGWNTTPYTGNAELYNDFGSFEVAITVPQDFLVWATGDLMNPADVLRKKYLTRLREAETRNGYVMVVSPEEAQRREITTPNARNTWRFRATDVSDFVFATSDHYAWQSTSLIVDPTTKRRTRCDAVYDPKHKDFEEVVRYTRQTVEAMSFQFPKWPFPYAHITVFDGLDQMEYPMMVNDNAVDDRVESITLTDHEVFHTMFPFYMGTNETLYGWMDEGWATLGEWIIAGIIDPKIADDYGMPPYNALAGTESDPPVMTLTPGLTDRAVLLNSYVKPALGYRYVQDLLGDELFTKALHQYIRTWHGKHPLPLDFFNAMNAGAGQNLNWFWRRWFYENGVPDLALASVEVSSNGGGIIRVEAHGAKPVPIDLTISFTDGTTQQLHRSIGVWATGATHVILAVTSPKEIKAVKLGSLYVADANPADNEWKK
jgi:Peptidase family M1 domain